jgi:hypothetical protein
MSRSHLRGLPVWQSSRDFDVTMRSSRGINAERPDRSQCTQLFASQIDRTIHFCSAQAACRERFISMNSWSAMRRRVAVSRSVRERVTKCEALVKSGAPSAECISDGGAARRLLALRVARRAKKFPGHDLRRRAADRQPARSTRVEHACLRSQLFSMSQTFWRTKVSTSRV